MGCGIKFLIERYYRLLWNEDVTFHEILRRLYLIKNLSIRDMAEELGISVGAVHKFLKEEGIEKNISCKK